MTEDWFIQILMNKRISSHTNTQTLMLLLMILTYTTVIFPPDVRPVILNLRLVVSIQKAGFVPDGIIS